MTKGTTLEPIVFLHHKHHRENAEFSEKAREICFGKSYVTYSDGLWKTFACDKGYVNCRVKNEKPITKSQIKDKSTVYYYGKGTSRGVRTPTDQKK